MNDETVDAVGAVGAGDSRDRIFGADRAKAFIDAVVAIAMTLLILPLMEAVTAPTVTGSHVAGGDGATWFASHGMLLISFVVSFTIIAMFWIEHHRMFAHVRRVTTGMLWLNMAWLLTIVWLPVVTAMSDRMSSGDGIVVTAYIGSMAATSLLMLAQRLFLKAQPALHDFSRAQLVNGVAADVAMAALFLISLAVAVLVPDISYFALFLLALTGRLKVLILRFVRGGSRRRRRQQRVDAQG